MEDLINEVVDAIRNCNLKNRFESGSPGELMTMLALAANIIPNAGWGWAPKVKNEETWSKDWWDEVYTNRANGDLWFVDPVTYHIKYIDAKSTSFISQKSMNGFRPDGYYLLDAWYRPTNEDYKNGKRSAIPCMVSSNEDFKNHMREHAKKRQGYDNKQGYDISFTDIKSEWIYQGFDGDAYTKLMRRVWDLSDYWSLEKA